MCGVAAAQWYEMGAWVPSNVSLSRMVLPASAEASHSFLFHLFICFRWNFYSILLFFVQVHPVQFLGCVCLRAICVVGLS